MGWLVCTSVPELMLSWASWLRRAIPISQASRHDTMPCLRQPVSCVCPLPKRKPRPFARGRAEPEPEQSPEHPRHTATN
eukprot:5103265-Prymnesium_polylepis.1